MAILSIVTPIGVLIGIIVTVHMEQVRIECHHSEYKDSQNDYFCCWMFVYLGFLLENIFAQAGGAHVLAIGVLQGLAAGTLLYITFYEVSPQLQH